MTQRFPIDLNLNRHAKHVAIAIATVIIWISFARTIKSIIKDS